MPGRRWAIVGMQLVTPDYPMRVGEYGQYAVVRIPKADTILEGWLKHWSSRPILLDVFGVVRSSERGSVYPARLAEVPDQTILKQLKQAVEDEKLILLRPRNSGAAGAGNPDTLADQIAAAAKRERAAAAASRPTAKKTWVEFELRDQKGRPIPRARYRLKITDGSTREGVLDENGQVRVTGLDPGECEICFLDFDGREWHRS